MGPSIGRETCEVAEVPSSRCDDEEQLRTIASKLRQMTLRVAADVGAHQSKVHEASVVLCDTSEGVDQDAIIKAIADLVEANQQMERRLGDAQLQIRDQARAIQSAEDMALTDPVTGIPNRRSFDEHVGKRILLEDVEKNPTTLMMVDIDHFKKFNDTYGHRIGDEVLKHVASQLEARLAPFGRVARYGGEEFVVVFDDLAIEEIVNQADEVREAIGSQDFVIDDQRLRVTGSGGLAQRLPGESAASWIHRADTALYAAKDAGRNLTFWMDGDDPQPMMSANEPDSSIAEDSITKDEVDTLESNRNEERGVRESRQVRTVESLASSSAETLSKLQSEGISFCLLMVRVDGDASDPDREGVVLSSIQKAVRGIDTDRIAFDGDSVFAACLPGVNETVALQRGEAAIEAIREGYQGSSGWEIRFSVTSANSTESFEELWCRAVDACERSEATRIEGP